MKLRLPNQRTVALTLAEVLVVIAMVLVLAALLIPSLAHSGRSNIALCLNNLKQIGLAYNVWAGDHNGKFPMQVSVADGGTKEMTADGRNPWLNFLVMSNILVTPKLFICPADHGHIAATNFAASFSAKNISYFIGLDAATNYPHVFLSGDDNFAISRIAIRPGLLTVSTNARIVWTASSLPSWGAQTLRFPTNASVVWSDTRHVNRGNIVMADGSAKMTSSFDLHTMLVQTGIVTNRLAIP